MQSKRDELFAQVKKLAEPLIVEGEEFFYHLNNVCYGQTAGAVVDIYDALNYLPKLNPTLGKQVFDVIKSDIEGRRLLLLAINEKDVIKKQAAGRWLNTNQVQGIKAPSDIFYIIKVGTLNTLDDLVKTTIHECCHHFIHGRVGSLNSTYRPNPVIANANGALINISNKLANDFDEVIKITKQKLQSRENNSHMFHILKNQIIDGGEFKYQKIKREAGKSGKTKDEVKAFIQEAKITRHIEITTVILQAEIMFPGEVQHIMPELRDYVYKILHLNESPNLPKHPTATMKNLSTVSKNLFKNSKQNVGEKYVAKN